MHIIVVGRKIFSHEHAPVHTTAVIRVRTIELRFELTPKCSTLRLHFNTLVRLWVSRGAPEHVRGSQKPGPSKRGFQPAQSTLRVNSCWLLGRIQIPAEGLMCGCGMRHSIEKMHDA